MPRKCTICTHPKRLEIEKLFLNGVTYRDISRQHSVSKDAVCRHIAEHVYREMAAAKTEEAKSRTSDLFGELDKLSVDARRILASAEHDNDYHAAIKALSELRRQLEIIAKLRGELIEHTTINLIASPQFVQVQSVLITALSPYPEAKGAVVSALAQISQDAQSIS